MFSFLRRRQNTDTLIWEYLDGDISPTRAEQLSSMLAKRDAARQRFVEAAVMHGMLFDYFKNEHAATNNEQTDEQADAQGEMPKRRKRHGRSSAA